MRKISLRSDHKKSLFINLMKNIIEHKRIITTLSKAKLIRPIFEKMITKAKKYNLEKREFLYRLLLSRLGNCNDCVKKLVLISSNIKSNGGYTRITKCGYLKNSTPIAAIEIII